MRRSNPSIFGSASIFGSLVVAAVLASPALAVAQGNSAFGHSHNGSRVTAPSSTNSSSPSSSSGSVPSEGPSYGVDVRNFGTWLDDASIMGPGSGFVTIGFAYWRGSAFREFDVPMVDSGVAIHDRVQVGMSFPYYYASEPGGPVTRGFGNMYMTTKVQLHDPASHPVGFAVTPMIEVLDTAPLTGGSRVNWALPANVEFRRDGWRAFGSGGYFSRGALFASGAIEAAFSDRAWGMASLSQTYSTKADELTTALALPRGQTDLTGGLTFALNPKIAIYGTIGHTISHREINAGTLNLTGGVSFNFSR
jgi:hypothetical protein